jgi:F-type H+-transporting ATPase subunit gamma
VPCSASHIRAAVQDILVRIDDWRTQYRVEDVRLYYSRHLSSVGYRAQERRILPFDPERLRGLQDKGWPSRVLPTFTVAPENLLASLVGEYLFISLFQACAESQASEHGSRLAAMQSAERNLDERLDEVKGQFRRLRQEAITSELLDLVAGFEAIGGEGLERSSQR